MATFETKEKTGAKYTATLTDADGTAITLASISAITLTLYNVATDATINNRSTQNVKNLNNVTIHATSGLLTWLMQPEDNVIAGTGISIGAHEHHRALFEFTYTGNGSPGKHEVDILVENLNKVPTPS